MKATIKIAKATLEVEFVPTQPPNFVRAIGLTKDGAMVPIEQLTDAQVEAFIASWAEQLRAHVKARRKAAEEAKRHG